MAIKVSATRASLPSGSGTGTRKPKLSIFEDQQNKVLDKLQESIEHANGRYGSTDVEPNPLPDTPRSKCWTVKKKADGDAQEEICEVTVRVGQGLWECFEEQEGVKDSTSRFLVNGDMLAPTLQEIHASVKAMTRDESYDPSTSMKNGKADHTNFHSLAYAAVARKATGTYNPIEDKFEK